MEAIDRLARRALILLPSASSCALELVEPDEHREPRFAAFARPGVRRRQNRKGHLDELVRAPQPDKHWNASRWDRYRTVAARVLEASLDVIAAAVTQSDQAGEQCDALHALACVDLRERGPPGLDIRQRHDVLPDKALDRLDEFLSGQCLLLIRPGLERL